MEDNNVDVQFVFDSDRKRVSINGVKYIRCWTTARKKTMRVPKCRKQYMVHYRLRKKDEVKRLREIVDEQHNIKDVNTELSSARTDVDTSALLTLL
jgi:hypothetical protein